MINTRKNCNRVFAGKSYGAEIYKWTPSCPDFTNKNTLSVGGQKPVYCTATPSSQGSDWLTSYVYNLVVVNSVQEHSAYVECDYVR